MAKGYRSVIKLVKLSLSLSFCKSENGKYWNLIWREKMKWKEKKNKRVDLEVKGLEGRSVNVDGLNPVVKGN